MHVLVATDGSLDAAKASALVAPLAGDTGRVTVLTVVEVPRQLLAELRSEAESRPVPSAPADRGGDRVGDSVTTWIGDDAFVDNYVRRVVSTRTADLVAAFEAASATVDVVGVEGENASRSILDAVAEHEPDVLCVGSHGTGRFEGLLGSSSTKLARLAPCSVLVIR